MTQFVFQGAEHFLSPVIVVVQKSRNKRGICRDFGIQQPVLGAFQDSFSGIHVSRVAPGDTIVTIHVTGGSAAGVNCTE